MKKVLFALVALLVLAMPFAANAQSEITLPDTAKQGSRVPNPIVITEDQINESFRVSNPPSRRWTDVAVDLQSGQVVISGNLTLRAPLGQGTTSYAVSAIFTASVSSGRIYWALDSATANGQPATQQLITQINNSIASSWRNYIRTNARSGHFTSVNITDSQIELSWQ